jgi:hypothetical protein
MGTKYVHLSAGWFYVFVAHERQSCALYVGECILKVLNRNFTLHRTYLFRIQTPLCQKEVWVCRIIDGITFVKVTVIYK